MTIECSGTYTREDLEEAVKHLTHQRMWLRNLALVFVVLFMILGVVASAAGRLSDGVPLLLFATAALMVIFGLPWWTARRVWKASPSLNTGPVEFRFESEGVRIKSPLSDSTTKWNALPRWKETPGLFLLFCTSQVAQFVPKHFLASEAEIDSLRRLLEEKLGKPR